MLGLCDCDCEFDVLSDDVCVSNSICTAELVTLEVWLLEIDEVDVLLGD